MHRTVPAVAVAALLVLAGCGGGVGTPSSEMPSNSPTSTVDTESPTPADEPTDTPTDEPVGTSGYETDLDVRSYEETSVSLNVSITRNQTGNVIFSENLTIEPDGVHNFDIPFPEPGNYTVRAVRNGTVYTYVWELEFTDPSYELIVEANDGQVYFGKSAA